jgi:hypothetical protein
MRKSYYEPSHKGVFRTGRRARELLAFHPSGLGVSQVADALRISQGAANTALVKLRRDGIVDRVGLATYRLKARVVEAPPPCGVTESFIRPVSLSQLMAGR